MSTVGFVLVSVLLWPALLVGAAAIVMAWFHHPHKSSLQRNLAFMFSGPIALLLWALIFQKHNEIVDHAWVTHAQGILAILGMLLATGLAVVQAHRKWSWLILLCWTAAMILSVDWWFIGIMIIKNEFL